MPSLLQVYSFSKSQDPDLVVSIKENEMNDLQDVGNTAEEKQRFTIRIII